ncbi:MAG: hypothetical protein KatS3mg046_110 [Bellilinea sp.]|nr:MAG: hypothetical protein KatS3mg046_110 [Bellilinea sp.]
MPFYISGFEVACVLGLMAYKRLGWCKHCNIVFSLRNEPKGRRGRVVCPKCESSRETEEISHERALELIDLRRMDALERIYTTEQGYFE